MREKYVCNICGVTNTIEENEFPREGQSCPNCFSYVRVRGLMIILSQLVYGKHQAIADFDVRKEISIIGLSDWPGYADRIKNKFNYINTHFQSPEPSLDISKSIEGYDGRFDFVICSDVLEHVTTPVQPAFDNLFHLLKPGGTLIFSVPYNLEEKTTEHFPDLCTFEIVFDEGEQPKLRNETVDGEVQWFEDLIFHGAPEGAALEMRVFCERDVFKHLELAGFANIEKANWESSEFGVRWIDNWSLPLVARKPI